MTQTQRIDGTEVGLTPGADRVVTSLRLGYKASAEQFGPVELLDFGIHAEQLGFDSVVVSDHFQPWRHTGGHAPFSFAWLGALGLMTRRVLIGAERVMPLLRRVVVTA